MNDRVHGAIDGELDPAQLNPAERNSYDAVLRASDDTARMIVGVPAPDLTAEVMAAIKGLPLPAVTEPPLLTRVARWFWERREVSLEFRPLYAAAALMALSVGVGWFAAGFGRAGEMVEVAAQLDSVPAPAAEIYVQFRLDAPGAQSVEVIGSFTGWSTTVPLVESLPGVWSALLPLAPGVHDYTFVVDGSNWVTDPLSPSVNDGFGGLKNRLFLTDPMENV